MAFYASFTRITETKKKNFYLTWGISISDMSRWGMTKNRLGTTALNASCYSMFGSLV